MNRSEFVQKIIPHTTPKKSVASSWAPINIALCKYWGKRDQELNLPTASSLSVTLSKGTRTTISCCSDEDLIFLNDKKIRSDDPFAQRLFRFLSFFRKDPSIFFSIHTENEVPTKAGLASSASGFAAAVLALNDLFEWDLKSKDLSLLARIGSGSACRSVDQGFMLWHRGDMEDGMDSFAERLNLTWPELRVGVVLVSSEQKDVGSKEGMERTQTTSSLYPLWPQLVEQDITHMLQAVEDRDFSRFGKIIESNALSMHATMLSAWPPLCYWTEKTLNSLKKIWNCRKEGLDIYATMDAGPNIKLFYLTKDEHHVLNQFPDLLKMDLLQGDRII